VHEFSQEYLGEEGLAHAVVVVATSDEAALMRRQAAYMSLTLSEYFRLDFSADRNIRPLLAGQSLSQVRLALSLALEQAQWAALHGQTQVYRQALGQAREVLDAHFVMDNPNSRALGMRIDELVDRPIEVETPDLSQTLNAVQAYIQSKQSAREQFGVDTTDEAADAEEARP